MIIVAAKTKKSNKKKTSSAKHSKTAVNTSSKKSVDTKSNSDTSIMKSKKYIALVILLLLAGSLYLLRGKYLAATVNGTPISRFAVLQELETQSGPAVLDQLVSETLVKQEAKDKGVVVSDSDIDAEISDIQNNIEAQGQNLDDLLALQGMTMGDLRDRLDTQLTLEKMLEDKVTVDQSEVDDFIEQSSDSLPEDMSAEEVEKLARDQLVQTKLQTEIQKYLQELRESANIEYFGLYQQ